MERNHVVIGLDDYNRLIQERDEALQIKKQLMESIKITKSYDADKLTLVLSLPKEMQDHIRYLIRQEGLEYAISEYRLKEIDVWGIAGRQLGTVTKEEPQDEIDRAIKEIEELNAEDDIDVHNATEDGLPF